MMLFLAVLALVFQVRFDPDLGISDGLARERGARLSNVRWIELRRVFVSRIACG